MGTICKDTGWNSILLYSACQGRRAAPWGGNEQGEEADPSAGCALTRCPTASTRGGQRRGLVMGPMMAPSTVRGWARPVVLLWAPGRWKQGEAWWGRGPSWRPSAHGALSCLSCMSLVSREKQTSSLIMVERAAKPNGKIRPFGLWCSMKSPPR